MAFVVSVRQLTISGASPGITVSMPNTPVSGPNLTINLPSPQYFNFGMLRVKSNPLTTGTLQVTGIWASDTNASNTTHLYAGDRAAANVPVDHTYFPLVTDIQANQVIVGLTVGGGTCDVEFAAV
jgi:hypothetical protein